MITRPCLETQQLHIETHYCIAYIIETHYCTIHIETRYCITYRNTLLYYIILYIVLHNIETHYIGATHTLTIESPPGLRGWAE